MPAIINLDLLSKHFKIPVRESRAGSFHRQPGIINLSGTST
jgi:hypothetical protein